MKYLYRANRGGHAPEHLRDAIIEWIEKDKTSDVCTVGERKKPLIWLIGQLWNCTDMMPSYACDYLDMPQGSSYAQAVRKIRAEHKK